MLNSEYKPPTVPFEISHYLELLWWWAWLIVLITGLAVGIAYFVSKSIKPVYQAKTTVLVNEAPSSTAIDISSVNLSTDLALTYSQMMTKSLFLDEVAKRLGLAKLDPTTVTAIPEASTQLINITAESTDPAMAAQIANTLVQVFSNQIQSIQAARFSASEQSLQSQIADTEEQIQLANHQSTSVTDPAELTRLTTKIASYQLIYSNLLQSYEQVRLTETQTISSVVLVEPATAPDRPVRPNTLQNMALAGVLGLLLSAGLVLGRDLLDDTIRTPEDITQKLGLPVLGVIMHHQTKEGELDIQTQSGLRALEAYRTLRTNLQCIGSSIDSPIKTILVTSPMKGEGKTTTLVNLGVVMAQNGHKVMLLDADMRQPDLHHSLGLSNDTGLSQVFTQETGKLNGSVQSTKVDNLLAVTAGSLPTNPSELLGSKRMGAILEQLKAGSEIILIDTPPALSVTDAAVLIPLVDGVVMVIKPGTTRLAAARHLVNQLRLNKANLLGVVLNNVNLRRLSYTYDYFTQSNN